MMGRTCSTLENTYASVSAVKAYPGVEVKLYSYLTSLLDGRKWSVSRSYRFNPGMFWIGQGGLYRSIEWKLRELSSWLKFRWSRELRIAPEKSGEVTAVCCSPRAGSGSCSGAPVPFRRRNVTSGCLLATVSQHVCFLCFPVVQICVSVRKRNKMIT